MVFLIKKSNVIGVNFSKKAILCLQRMGYLDGNKKSTGRKLSSIISDIVCEHLRLHHPADERFVKERMLVLKLHEITKQRNQLEEQIQDLGLKITALRTTE